MDTPTVSLLDLVETWGPRPSDPLLSEHTRLAVEDETARVYLTHDRDAAATVVPTSLQGVGLVELAAKKPPRTRAFWDTISADLMSQAAADGYHRLEVLDRGSVLDLGEGRAGRSTLRMVLSDPDSVTRSTDHFSADDVGQILQILNSSFAGHPENGDWSLHDLRRRLDDPVFHQECFPVRRAAGEITAFCWSKVHPDGVGEIYLIAVAEEARGRGLGRRLLREGISHLVNGHSSDEVLVYTDAANTAAIELYEDEGFVTERVDRRFEIDL